MGNRKGLIHQKESGERNKQVWILKTMEGKVLSKFRQKKVEEDKQNYYEKALLTETILERDKSYIKNLKKKVQKKEVEK